MYRQVSNISRTLLGNKIVDHSDVVGASPVGAAPTTSSFSTSHLASLLDWAKTTARRDEKQLSMGIWCCLEIWRCQRKMRSLTNGVQVSLEVIAVHQSPFPAEVDRHVGLMRMGMRSKDDVQAFGMRTTKAAWRRLYIKRQARILTILLVKAYPMVVESVLFVLPNSCRNMIDVMLQTIFSRCFSWKERSEI